MWYHYIARLDMSKTCQVNLITFTFWVIDMPLNCFFGIHHHGIVELRPSVLCRQFGCKGWCKVYGGHSPIFPLANWVYSKMHCTSQLLYIWFCKGLPFWPQDISFYLVWCGCFDHLHWHQSVYCWSSVLWRQCPSPCPMPRDSIKLSGLVAACPAACHRGDICA